MILSNPTWLLLLVVAFAVAIVLKRHAYLSVPQLPGTTGRRSLGRRLLSGLRSVFTRPVTTCLPRLPRMLLVLALACVTVALTGPQVISHLSLDSTVNGRDIIFALDYSGSMAEKFKGKVPPLKNKDPFSEEAATAKTGEPTADSDTVVKPQEDRRIDAAQAFILLFVERRMEAQGNDAIGLIAFDQRPRLCWPLDRDLKQISRHGNFIPKTSGPGGLGSGTNFGTEMPGPIDLAAEHFNKRGRSQTRVLVLVSDGDNKLDAKVQQRLVKVIRQAGMRLYVVGVGEVIAKNDVDILKVAREVDGTVFRVERAEDMEKCFQTIDALESSPVPVTTNLLHEELFYIPLALGLALFLVWLSLEAILYGK